MTIDWESLRVAAEDARTRAHAPYSRYAVGAALLAKDGRVFSAANVENASYGLCLCAERNAFGTAVSSGAREFEAIVVVTASSPAAMPCGMCRQVLAELGPPFLVRGYAPDGTFVESTTAALLPFAFSGASLDDAR